MPVVELQQGRIHYREAGPRAGHPIVFVHGVLMGGDLWEPLTARLAERRLRCLAPTWPMGAHAEPMRPGTDLSPSGMAQIVADFLAALDLRGVVLVGNDSGGAISQVVAAEHPTRLGALVLTNCDTLEHFPPGALKVLPALARVPGALKAAVWPLRFGPVRRSPVGFGLLSHHGVDHLAAGWSARLLGDRAVFEDARRFVAGASADATLEAARRLRAFEGPVVMAWGADDALFTVGHARRFAEVVGGVRLELISGSRTFVLVDQPARLAGIVAAVAAGVSTAAAVEAGAR